MDSCPLIRVWSVARLVRVPSFVLRLDHLGSWKLDGQGGPSNIVALLSMIFERYECRHRIEALFRPM